MHANQQRAGFGTETHNVIHLAAIVVAIVLLAVGLYSVARETGRLLQMSRTEEVLSVDQGTGPVVWNRGPELDPPDTQ
jgi:hypothetical protein